MSEHTSPCRDCGKEIHWHKSKAGRFYPCDSDDRKNFHVCKNPGTFTKPSLAEQLSELREQLAKLTGRVGQLEAKGRGDVF